MYFQLYKSGFEVFKNYPIFGVGNKNYRIETCKSVTEQRKYGYNEKELIEAKLYSLQKLWYILRKTLDELID